MDDATIEEFAAKLAPVAMTGTLARAACVLTAYELLKAQVVPAVREFFALNASLLGGEDMYQREVRSRHRSEYSACVLWLVEFGAIEKSDAAVLEDLHRHRQEVAHELPRLLVDPSFDVRIELLEAAGHVLHRLGVFWARVGCVEADGVEDDDIHSGSSVLYSYVLDLVRSGAASAA